MYTSGTSGRPRGAMLSHRALLANLEQCAAIRPAVVTPADVLLLVLPLFHVYGLNPGLGMIAWAGATGVLVERFDPAETLALLARHRVTNVPAAPPMYTAWAEHPGVAAAFGTVRLALSGAAPLPAEALQRFAELGVPIYEGYGLSETAPVLTSTLIGGAAKPGSVGRPIPGVELVLRDEEGLPVEDDDPGEIAVRGPNLFSGYWPDRTGGPGADGWYATGDVAYADDQGDLHLVDRRQELILVSGFNVYPAEVEAVLAAHPAVEEVAVIGVPDRRTGEGVQAYVVRRPDLTLTADELLSWASASLARFKLPGSVHFLPALPHSATGKVSKAQLRDLPAATSG
jgi:long-chain acyl-CoA synthetase